jgi:hypothetical protein
MISLTIAESEVEFISGIPSYITFSTDVPSTVYYTLDGETPGVNSLIAVGKVYMPTSSRGLTLKAIAISPTDTSVVTTKKYSTDSEDYNGPRRIGDEGISILPPSGIVLESLSFDSSGDAAQETAIAFVDLDVKASKVSTDGVWVEDGKTSVPFVNFPKANDVSDRFTVSTVNDNVEFDPRAKFITIDGSTQAKLDEQVVKIVNRTYSTFGPTSKFYDERLGESEPLVTGNYIRSFYDEARQLFVSYYWESLESRWIRSVQRAEGTVSKNGASSRNHFVYRWIQDRSVSGAF